MGSALHTHVTEEELAQEVVQVAAVWFDMHVSPQDPKHTCGPGAHTTKLEQTTRQASYRLDCRVGGSCSRVFIEINVGKSGSEDLGDQKNVFFGKEREMVFPIELCKHRQKKEYSF